MHNGCVLWGGVGSGKTVAALAYAKAKEPGKPVVVVTTAKVRDSLAWHKWAAKMAFKPDAFDVTSWNKINDLVDLEDHFVIFDEQRLVGSGAWVKAFYKIAKKNRWILLSATPGDTWSDYAPMFIANGWYKNITEFRREHAIYSRFTKYPKIERWINQGKLQKYRSQLLVKMPMERHTTRHIHHIECDYDKDLLEVVRKKRWNIYKDEPIRNAAELFGVMRKVVSTDPSRVLELKKLIRKHPKLIIFYNYNYELDILREVCKELENLTNKNGDLSWVLKESTTSTKASLAESATLSRSSGRPGKIRLTDEKPLGPAAKSSSESTGSSRQQPTQRQPKESLTTPSTNSPQPLTTTPLAEAKIFDWAEWNGHKHQPLPQSESWIYLVQYNSGSEGWNCIETDSMAFWSLTYSWKQYNQAQGRIDRLNTPYTDLHYYVMLTNSPAEKPVMRALDQKHDFQPR